MIRPPEAGKTKLAKEAMKLQPNRRFVSRINTTGLSLTAMNLNDKDSHVLHLGPVPGSKYAICAINEIDKLDPNKQNNLRDVMGRGHNHARQIR
jgi:DNA replicative helicase MCM subunit Mcm2 (Cdc46/Mcm family)